MRTWLRFLVATLLLSPLGATASDSPQVVMATTGAGAGSIERFTMR